MTGEVVIGRHEIDGDDVFALGQVYETTSVETRQYEVHRRYLDVQYIHRGHKLIYWTRLATLTNGTMVGSLLGLGRANGAAPMGVAEVSGYFPVHA